VAGDAGDAVRVQQDGGVCWPVRRPGQAAGRRWADTRRDHVLDLRWQRGESRAPLGEDRGPRGPSATTGKFFLKLFTLLRFVTVLVPFCWISIVIALYQLCAHRKPPGICAGNVEKAVRHWEKTVDLADPQQLQVGFVNGVV
jgi:hypothetical protein